VTKPVIMEHARISGFSPWNFQSICIYHVLIHQIICLVLQNVTKYYFKRTSNCLSFQIIIRRLLRQLGQGYHREHFILNFIVTTSSLSDLEPPPHFLITADLAPKRLHYVHTLINFHDHPLFLLRNSGSAMQ
jgi:hypothetical protein